MFMMTRVSVFFVVLLATGACMGGPLYNVLDDPNTIILLCRNPAFASLVR